MIQKAIIDWSSSVIVSKNNFTDRCFSRYFYNVFKYDFYNVEVIKSILPELYKVAKASNAISYHNGDIMFSEHFGNTKKGRSERIFLLTKVIAKIIENENRNAVNRLMKDSLDIKDENGLTKNNWNAIYQSYIKIKQNKLEQFAKELGL